MAHMSKAERFFKSTYPNAHIRPTEREIAGYKVVAVYCGDYLCSEGLTAQDAYKRAQEYVDNGYITPDPNELRREAYKGEDALQGGWTANGMKL